MICEIGWPRQTLVFPSALGLSLWILTILSPIAWSPMRASVRPSMTVTPSSGPRGREVSCRIDVGYSV